MAEGDSYALRLIDKLTAPARKMTESIHKVTRASDAATQAVDRVGAATARTGAKAAAGASGLRAFAAAARVAERARGLGRDVRAGASNVAYVGRMMSPFGHSQPEFIGPRRSRGAELGAGLDDLVGMNRAAGETMTKWSDMNAVFMQTPVGRLASGFGFVAGKVYDLGVQLAGVAFSAAKVTWALGAIGAAYVTKEVIELAAFSERARKSLTALTGSSAQGNEAFERARRVAGELGMGVEQVAQSFIELRAAQFSIEQSEALTKLSADLATVTGHADAAGRIINAISKIKATGRLQGDELMMLAEAGLSLDMVYSRLEKNMGKTREGVLKAQQAGKISADQAITAIQEAIMEKTHERVAGQAAGAFAVETLSGAWRALQAAPRNWLLKVGEAIDTGPLTVGMNALIRMFNQAGTSKLAPFVNRMVEGLGRLMTVVPHFVEGFSSGFERITAALSFGSADWEGGARRAGELLATFFAKSIEIANKLGPVLFNAAESFFGGFDVEAISKWFESVDWGTVANQIAAIAKALGEVYGWALRLAPTVVGAAGVAAHTVMAPTIGGPFGSDSEKQIGADLSLIQSIAGNGKTLEGGRSPLSPMARGEGMIASLTRGALGMDESKWFDPDATTGAFAPTSADVGPNKDALAAAGGVTNHTVVNINGATMDEKKLVGAVKNVLAERDATTARQLRAAP